MPNLPEHILEQVPRLCSLCHLFPVMKANPANFCSVCVLAQRKKVLSDKMLGILEDRGARPPEWRIPPVPPGDGQGGHDAH